MKHFGGCRRFGLQPVVASVLAVALLGFLLPTASVSASDSSLSSEQVAAEILRVQGLANETAQQWAEADLRSEELAGELTIAEDKLAEANAQYSKLESDLSEIAIDRFTSASSQSMMILFDDPTEEMQVNELRNLALDVGATDLDYIDSVRSDLADAQSAVQALKDENILLAEELAAREVDLDVQLGQLTTLREHLEDEEVKRAYEEQLATQREGEVEQQTRAAAAVATAPPSPAKGGGAQPTATTPSSPQARQTPTASIPSAPVATAPKSPEDAEPVPEPEPEPPPVVNVGSGWICPVAGPNAFGDTWGAPRSGGRSHQGVDMMSPGGTSLVAVVAGSATMKTNTLGGNVVWLTGVDGDKYYYAHLSAWEGSARSVSAGEVIGYVGATGNTSANHLHFEIHPGGGAAVNPTPTVRQYC
jgi:murein DD-endopeptidase MepM/ murein hydrolase activator NlpD